VIDIHSHLLPGVDDGSPSLEASVPVLERFADDGVEVLVCTPHLVASEAHQVGPHTYREIFEALCAAPSRKPELRLGWEIMLDLPGVDLTAPHLHLGGSTAALVEFSRMNVPPTSVQELARIRASGVVPVLAHPERYWGCTPQMVQQWRQAGAVIQMDAAMLVGRGETARVALSLLEHGLVDCIASDNHGDSRNLLAARIWLEELGAEEQAHLLTHLNPKRLLANMAMLPSMPLPRIERGMVTRLRELIFGRR
jgi:protein-tyrosine phosphatase